MLISGLHHQLRSARGGAGDDADRFALALDVGVDGRVGADVGRVDGAGVEGLDRGGACVEDLGAELGLAEVPGDQALADPDEGRGVGDVAEVAELEFGSRGVDGGGGCRGFVRAGRRGCDGGAGADQQHEADGQADLQGALAPGFGRLTGYDPGGSGRDAGA